jgi:hypothetical protein
MDLGATIARMKACGMSADAIVQALECVVMEPAADAQAERRRAADRDRKRDARLRNSAESAESADTPSPLVPPLEVSPRPLSKTPPIIPPTSTGLGAGASRGSRLPETFLPSLETLDTGRKRGLTDADLTDELEKFRDWANAATGQVSIKRDWQAAFRNWIKRAADEKRRKPQARTSHGQDMRDAFDAVDDHIAGRRAAAGYR